MMKKYLRVRVCRVGAEHTLILEPISLKEEIN